MFCRNCGFELADGAMFCSNCGAPTKSYEHAEQQRGHPIQQPEPAPRQQPSVPQQASFPPAAPAAAAYTKRDLRWTLKQTLFGKLPYVLIVDAALAAILTVVRALAKSGDASGALNLFGGAAEAGIGMVSGGIEHALSSVAIGLSFPILLMMVLLVPSAVLVMAFLNARGHKEAPTREAVEAHREEARFSWRLIYGLILGFFDAYAISSATMTIAFVVGGRSFNNFMLGHLNTFSLFFTGSMIVGLGVAELRMRRLSRMFRSRDDKNERIINGLLSGALISEVPEGFADELGIAKIVRLLDMGAAYSIKGAVRLIKLVDLKSKALGINSFIGSWISAIVNTCMIGMLDILDININDATTLVARGQGIERVKISATRKKPVFEIICLAWYVIAAITYLAYGMA